MVMFVQVHVMATKTLILSLSGGPGEDAAGGLHSSAEGLQPLSPWREQPT